MSKLPGLIARNRVETALLAAGCVLRLARFNAKSLWYDEASTLVVCRSGIARLLFLLRSLETNAPLYYVLMHYWTRLFSDPAFGLRLFSVLCGIACLPVFLLVCRRLVPANAPFAFFLGCFSSFWIHAAQDGRCYPFFLLLTLAETYVALRLADRWSPALLLAYGSIAIAGMYTHYYFNFFHFTVFIYLCLRSGSDVKRLSSLLAVNACLLALYIPWLGSIRVEMGREAAARTISEPLTVRHLGTIFGTLAFDASVLGFVLEKWVRGIGFAILALMAVALRQGWGKPGRSGERRNGLFCLAHMIVPLLCAASAERVLGIAITQVRYFIFLSPFLFLAIAETLGRLKSPWPGIGRAVVEAVFAAALVAYYAASVALDPQLSSLTERIRARGDPRAIVVHLNPWHYLSMRYYYLPELPHYFVPGDVLNIDWKALPGYPAILAKEELGRRGSCVVIDPARAISRHPYWPSTGKQLLRILRERPEWR